MRKATGEEGGGGEGGRRRSLTRVSGEPAYRSRETGEETQGRARRARRADKGPAPPSSPRARRSTPPPPRPEPHKPRSAKETPVESLSRTRNTGPRRRSSKSSESSSCLYTGTPLACLPVRVTPPSSLRSVPGTTILGGAPTTGAMKVGGPSSLSLAVV